MKWCLTLYSSLMELLEPVWERHHLHSSKSAALREVQSRRLLHSYSPKRIKAHTIDTADFHAIIAQALTKDDAPITLVLIKIIKCHANQRINTR